MLEHAVRAREAHSLFIARLAPAQQISAPGLTAEVQQQLRSSQLPRLLQSRLAPAASESQLTCAELTFVPIACLPDASSSPSLDSSQSRGVHANDAQSLAETRARCLALCSTSLTGAGPTFGSMDLEAMMAATPDRFRTYWIGGLQKLSIELVRVSSHPSRQRKVGEQVPGQRCTRVDQLAMLSHELLAAANAMYSIQKNSVLDCCGVNFETGNTEVRGGWAGAMNMRREVPTAPADRPDCHRTVRPPGPACVRMPHCSMYMWSACLCPHWCTAALGLGHIPINGWYAQLAKYHCLPC